MGNWGGRTTPPRPPLATGLEWMARLSISLLRISPCQLGTIQHHPIAERSTFVVILPQGSISGPESLTSTALNIVSLASLALTLLTYSISPQLRTTPGVAIMQYTIAQLTFQLSRLPQDVAWLCQLVAALQHYFWLAAFCWTNCLAWNMYCTFSSMIPDVTAYSSRAMIQYSLYSWGLPATTVGCCLIVSNFGDMGFVYASLQSGQCWIAPFDCIMYAFVVPLGFQETANLILFVLAALTIQRTARNTTLTPHQLNQADHMCIYIKLASLLGFNWLCAMLTVPFPDIELFRYLRIILNGLQGIFLFVSFVLRKRVLEMCKNSMKKKSPDFSSQSTCSTL